jgi:hypothetical protein
MLIKNLLQYQQVDEIILPRTTGKLKSDKPYLLFEDVNEQDTAISADPDFNSSNPIRKISIKLPDSSRTHLQRSVTHAKKLEDVNVDRIHISNLKSAPKKEVSTSQFSVADSIDITAKPHVISMSLAPKERRVDNTEKNAPAAPNFDNPVRENSIPQPRLTHTQRKHQPRPQSSLINELSEQKLLSLKREEEKTLPYQKPTSDAHIQMSEWIKNIAQKVPKLLVEDGKVFVVPVRNPKKDTNVPVPMQQNPIESRSIQLPAYQERSIAAQTNETSKLSNTIKSSSFADVSDLKSSIENIESKLLPNDQKLDKIHAEREATLSQTASQTNLIKANHSLRLSSSDIPIVKKQKIQEPVENHVTESNIYSVISSDKAIKPLEQPKIQPNLETDSQSIMVGDMEISSVQLPKEKEEIETKPEFLENNDGKIQVHTAHQNVLPKESVQTQSPAFEVDSHASVQPDILSSKMPMAAKTDLNVSASQFFETKLDYSENGVFVNKDYKTQNPKQYLPTPPQTVDQKSKLNIGALNQITVPTKSYPQPIVSNYHPKREYSTAELKKLESELSEYNPRFTQHKNETSKSTQPTQEMFIAQTFQKSRYNQSKSAPSVPMNLL